MSRSIYLDANRELVDLNANRALGGHSYNHSGQLIKAETPYGGEWFFLGDEYGEYSALDSLVRNILEQPENWKIRGDITQIEDDGRYLTITTLTDDIDENDNDIKTEGVDYVRYYYLDTEVIVNHKSGITVSRA